jgi:hypothetical protein
VGTGAAEVSNRQIAAGLWVDDKTVGGVRNSLSAVNHCFLVFGVDPMSAPMARIGINVSAVCLDHSQVIVVCGTPDEPLVAQVHAQIGDVARDSADIIESSFPR